jgi:N-acyl amino acid synthase of PEP-CTERM/exosortase system
MLLQKLLGGRDILIPYFKFSKALRQQAESVLLKEIFHLRYEVYCLECHYLSPEEFQGGLEKDEFDACSTHFAAFSLENAIIGTVRLVQPSDGLMYPYESHCSAFADHVPPPRENAAEISRLVVKRTHRRRRGDSMEGVSSEFAEKGSAETIKPHAGGKKRGGNSPMLLLGLYREMYRHSRQNGIKYWYAAMEQSLAGSLSKMGFEFVPIGPETDYYGPVTPFIVNLDDADRELRQKNKFLSAWFNDEPIPFFVLIHALLENFWQKYTKPRKN